MTLSRIAIESVTQKSYIDQNAKRSAIMKKAEALVNLVIRLQKCLWKEAREVVTTSLEEILSLANGALSVQDKTHREVQKKIVAQIEELEKPWTINSAVIGSEIVEKANDTLVEWKNANVGWLQDPFNFAPSLLPVFHSTSDHTKGVYDTREEYFEIVHKLWIGLTFGEGHDSIAPNCCSRDGDKTCGRSLSPVTTSSQMCKGFECFQTAIYTCPNSFHDYSLCEECFRHKMSMLCSGNPKSASTHIYDASVDSFSPLGSLKLDFVSSRNPPSIGVQRSVYNLQMW